MCIRDRNNEPLRPDPDRLLEQAAAPHRGKLKVFFGACAGVGKTWAMLAEAQRLRAQGLDIVVGVVETHGRKAVSYTHLDVYKRQDWY